MPIIEYAENNSYGDRWLTDTNQHELAAEGWIVFRRFMRLTMAFKEFDNLETAIAEWEDITGQDASNPGCPCCGQPHNFSIATQGDVDYCSREYDQVYDPLDTALKHVPPTPQLTEGT